MPACTVTGASLASPSRAIRMAFVAHCRHPDPCWRQQGASVCRQVVGDVQVVQAAANLAGFRGNPSSALGPGPGCPRLPGGPARGSGTVRHPKDPAPSAAEVQHGLLNRRCAHADSPSLPPDSRASRRPASRSDAHWDGEVRAQAQFAGASNSDTVRAAEHISPCCSSVNHACAP